MESNRINWGRVVVAGLLATVIGFFVGFVLYSSANGVYERFGDLPYAKPIGSMPAYLGQMVVGSVVLDVLFALVYALVQERIPGQKPWQKGLAFGLMLLALNMLPIAFNTWMQIAQPVALILVEGVNRTVGLLVTGVVIAIVYGHPVAVGRAQQFGVDGLGTFD